MYSRAFALWTYLLVLNNSAISGTNGSFGFGFGSANREQIDKSNLLVFNAGLQF